MALASLQEKSGPAAVAGFSAGPVSPIGGARALLADFAQLAGAKGAIALGQVLGTALLEAFSISLLVPLLGLAFERGAQSGHAGSGATLLFSLLASEAPFQRLVLLLALFTLLMSLRATLSGMRDL